MFGKLHLRSLILAAAICSLIVSTEIYGNPVEKRVVFPKGKGIVTFRGKLPKEFDYDAYVFPARKGRFVTVKLSSSDPEAYFAIYETKQLGPDEDTIVENERRAVEWTGQLPANGEYSVQVYDAAENTINRASYSIEITLQ